MGRILWIFFLFLIGCSTPKQPSASLKIAFPTYPSTLDPARVGDFPSSTLISLIYEGLTRCHPKGGVENALIEKMEIFLNQKMYLFHLRKAYWSDGQPITAYDFERGWKKAIAPPSPSAHLFYPIKNGEKCAKGELPLEALGVTALNASTLEVELEYPTPYFISLTAFPSFLPAPSHAKEVFSGPFRIQKTAPNNEIILVKNERYWNQENIFLEEIHISIVPDEMTALHMFERGDLDWVGGSLSPLPPDAMDQIEAPFTFTPSAASTFVSFNTESGPFQNLHLRQAFALAINRAEIVEKVLPSGQIPATRLLPPSLTSGKPLFSLFDPTAARFHLQKALEEIDTASLPALILYYKPGQIEKRLAQTLQRQWKEILGLSVQLVQLDFKSHAYRLHHRNYHLCLASWIAQFDDPASLLDRFKDKANLKNYPGWESAKYIDLLRQAVSSSRRRELLEEAEAVMAAEMPIAPLYHWNPPVLYSQRLTQMGTTPCGGILFERFKLRSCQRFKG